jgi:hypothetical protein
MMEKMNFITKVDGKKTWNVEEVGRFIATESTTMASLKII